MVETDVEGVRPWSRAVTWIVVASAAAAGLWAWGCVAETGEGEPTIGVVDVICSESTSAQYEGQVVSRIEAPVSDPDDDIVRVTATVRGAVLTMNAEDEGIYVYAQSPDSETFIRCDAGLKVVIRVTDEVGNVAERDVLVNN